MAGQISSILQQGRQNKSLVGIFVLSRTLPKLFLEITYLLPKHSMISPVRVDLLLFSNAREAAFLTIADAPIQPKIVGFILNSLSPADWRAQERNTATLVTEVQQIFY